MVALLFPTALHGAAMDDLQLTDHFTEAGLVRHLGLLPGQLGWPGLFFAPGDEFLLFSGHPGDLIALVPQLGSQHTPAGKREIAAESAENSGGHYAAVYQW